INPYDGSFYSSIGGYSGKAVKPIALRFIAELAKDKDLKDHHISAMGGIENWVDALEFVALGADTVQVTTAVMQFGYRIVEDLIDGAAYYLNANGFTSIRDLKGTAVPNVVPTEELDRSFVIYPRFDRNKCVGCQRCYVSCMDGGHQAISIRDGKPVLDPKKCVGCHLCILVCPKQAVVSSQIRVPKKQG
ncbi:MAG: 4Fe-4S binding protein, partial [Erysipelotrichaceae bacterium]|nr:4Fe-4S binding protein [Erysipelotrichaceae bacterium]